MTLADITVPTQKALATFLDKPERTIGRWVRDHGMPRPPCNLRDVVIWLMNRTPAADMREQLDVAKLELTQEAAREKRLSNDFIEKNIFTRTAVNQWANNAMTQMREALMGLADTVANSMPPDQREFVRSEIDLRLRDAIARFVRAMDERDEACVEGKHQLKDVK